MLYNVDITDLLWTCAVYAMRRIGYQKTVHDFLNESRKPYDESQELNIGIVFVWNIETNYSTPAICLEDGFPISKYIKLNKHYGVYEGNGLVSDIQLLGDMNLPGIRFRKLSEIKTKPDWVLQL